MTTENLDRVEQLIALSLKGKAYVILNKENKNMDTQYRRVRQAFHMASHASHEFVFHLVRQNGVVTAKLLDGAPSERDMNLLIKQIAHHTGHVVIPALPDQESRLVLDETLAEVFQHDLA